MKKSHLILFAAALFCLAACDPTPDPENNTTAQTFVLNEGNWGGNDAEISVLNADSGTISNNYFSINNGRGLGDVAQDLARYGSHLYAVVSYSNTVEVVDPATGKSIKQISLPGKTPRHIAFHNGKAYVSCYDKTIVRIDTASLSVEAECPLSTMQAEELCITDNRIFVCSAWQYAENGSVEYDNKVSVVDLNSFKEISSITVGANPGKIRVLNTGNLIVNCDGNYTDDFGGLYLVNIANLTAQRKADALAQFDIYNGDIYGYSTSYDANWNATYRFVKISTDNFAQTPILQGAEHQFSSTYYPYGINIDPANGNIFLLAAAYGAQGDVIKYSPSGTRLWKAEAGFFPSKVIF